MGISFKGLPLTEFQRLRKINVTRWLSVLQIHCFVFQPFTLGSLMCTQMYPVWTVPYKLWPPGISRGRLLGWGPSSFHEKICKFSHLKSRPHALPSSQKWMWALWKDAIFRWEQSKTKIIWQPWEVRSTRCVFGFKTISHFVHAATKAELSCSKIMKNGSVWIHFKKCFLLFKHSPP